MTGCLNEEDEGLSMKRNYEKSCGAVVFRKVPDLEVLMVRQNQGHWCFPKGHVKDGESEAATAVREVNEETGLKIHLIGGFREETHYCPQEGVNKDVVWFIAAPSTSDLHRQEEEIAEVVWANLIDASALLTYDNDKQLFRKAVRYLRLIEEGEF